MTLEVSLFMQCEHKACDRQLRNGGSTVYCDLLPYMEISNYVYSFTLESVKPLFQSSEQKNNKQNFVKGLGQTGVLATAEYLQYSFHIAFPITMLCTHTLAIMGPLELAGPQCKRHSLLFCPRSQP